MAPAAAPPIGAVARLLGLAGKALGVLFRAATFREPRALLFRLPLVFRAPPRFVLRPAVLFRAPFFEALRFRAALDLRVPPRELLFREPLDFRDPAFRDAERLRDPPAPLRDPPPPPRDDSPASERSLFTVRAAISSARSLLVP